MKISLGFEFTEIDMSRTVLHLSKSRPNPMKQFVLILLLLSPGYFFGQSSGTWVEVQTQAVIVLNPDTGALEIRTAILTQQDVRR